MARHPSTSLEHIGALTGEALREEWRQVCKSEVPTISADLLRLGIAYAVQEARGGKLARTAQAALRAAAGNKGSATVIKPGTRLIREWNGRTIGVLAIEDGFVFEDRHYRSLSAIAGEVTGTSWSGPRFFGLHGVQADG